MVKPRNDRIPVNPSTGEPLSPKAQPGYYPGYSTMAQKEFWDRTTRELVENRVLHPPPIRFFSPYEEPTARAVFDRILPQDDRVPDRRVPILNYVDKKLYERKLSGYRFENIPDEPWAHRLGLRGIDAIARTMHQTGFDALSVHDQEEILLQLGDAQPIAGHFIWEMVDVGHYWALLIHDAASAYYSHPWAWDEIGFGGPAYPRGYMRLEKGMREPWEVDERRYAWKPPPDSVSGELKPLKGPPSGGRYGQGGTH